jgi:hypothetical protein
MEYIVNEVKTKEPAVNVKKLMTMLSFDADAINESQEWPYLWRKTNVKSRKKAVSSIEEMARKRARNRRFAKISLWGLVSIIMYLAIFLNQAFITKYFTQGGFFALAIVVTALSFALVHGTFAGYVLENLNYKAANRVKDEH